MSKAKAGPISADRLKSFIERIEKLEEERAAIGGDIRDVYTEAKGVGYDVKTMRKIVSIRKMDAAERDEQETLLDVYKHALGMETFGHAVTREPTEDELMEAVSVVVGEVERCMSLAVNGRAPKIEAIKSLIGCSAGKAFKVRRMVANRLQAEFSPSSTRIDENPEPKNREEASSGVAPDVQRSEPSSSAGQPVNSAPPLGCVSPEFDDGEGEQSGNSIHESCGRPEERTQAARLSGPQQESGVTRPNGIPTPTAGVASGPQDPLSDEIHRGAMQPEGCAKVMRTEPSMSGSVEASGDAVRDASAMPLDVVAAPYSEGREHAGSAATAPSAFAIGGAPGEGGQELDRSSVAGASHVAVVCILPDSPEPCPNTCALEGRCALAGRPDPGPMPDFLRRPLDRVPA